jgi:hypothetical protein
MTLPAVVATKTTCVLGEMSFKASSRFRPRVSMVTLPTAARMAMTNMVSLAETIPSRTMVRRQAGDARPMRGMSAMVWPLARVVCLRPRIVRRFGVSRLGVRSLITFLGLRRKAGEPKKAL